MRILEFGNKENKKLLLIHGFQSPWQVWNPFIAHYETQYHILVPVLPGHDPEVKEDFTTFADAAREIEDFCLSRFGNDIEAVYGMSMGGVLGATLWQNGRLHFNKVIFDGSPIAGNIPFLWKSMEGFYINITHQTQNRVQKVLDQAVGSIISKDNFEDFVAVLDNMSDTTIRNCLRGVDAFRLSQTCPSPDSQVYFFHGTAMNEMIAKRAAKFLQKHYPSVSVTCFQGKAHCENALLDPLVMLKALDAIL